MKNDTAVRVENIGKKYVIRHEERNAGSYQTFREMLGDSLKVWNRPPVEKEEFWALKDVSFDVEKGAKVGVIGRNGAGKSTLLKLLGRITEPTCGKIQIRGRIASLLEVGTGFHPELTGRENIFLNGAILGMKRKEIQTKFDEIVDFSGCEKFLDTPVKRYSSGMRVRLGFAVAAHLDSEILLIDEVLAVGDAEFQKKCLGKINGIAEDEGRTILFVSHNMNAIQQLCEEVILLDKGVLLEKSTDVRKVTHNYLNLRSGNSRKCEWIDRDGKVGNENFRLRYFGIHDAAGAPVEQAIKNDDNVEVVIEGTVAKPDSALQIGYAIYDEENTLLYWSTSTDSAESSWPVAKKGDNRFVSKIPKRFLNEGTYRLEVIAALYFRSWIMQPQKNSPSLVFTIQGGLSDSPYWMVRRPGILAPALEWRVE